jgi:hypothetical protein
LVPVHEEAPDEEKEGKDEGQCGVTDVSDAPHDEDNLRVGNDKQELSHRRDESERSEEKIYETSLKAGGK